jgi:hypothetical protein
LNDLIPGRQPQRIGIIDGIIAAEC